MAHTSPTQAPHYAYLAEYTSRFISEKETNHYSLQNSFFTQYSVTDYYTQLPYLPENELFCLRLYKAFVQNEKICIYADFDTDAVTATYVMYHGLLDQGFSHKNIRFYTPDRFKEGYGVNVSAIKKIAQEVELIITVDCGINSCLEAEYVTHETSCDLIITDHHLSQGIRPDCIAVCNPQMSTYFCDANYRAKCLAILEDLSKDVSRFDSTLNVLHYMRRARNTIQTMNNNTHTLSHSVTGVGVAWFSVLWFAYFLEEIQYHPENLS